LVVSDPPRPALTLIGGNGAGTPAVPRPLRQVALLGNHLPRQCGIATFTTDLAAAIRAEYPELDCFVVAMNDPGWTHAYPPMVRLAIEEGDAASYSAAASALNASGVDVVSLQHEYGIFGGPSGELVLGFLRELRAPIVTTLHTILAAPDPTQRRVLDAILKLSARVVVMSAHGAATLRETHGVAAEKIDLIPHGIPAAVFGVGDKDRLGVSGRPMLLTFGLLAPDKGIEFVIDALPAILADHPEAVYVVLGATHPHVIAQAGESYRHQLEDRARLLGVADAVIFHDRFVSQEELGEFLSATDIYITPYLNTEQSTSGTLAYAIGAGKAVISTPYRYARELLADGRGILVPSRDAAAIAREVSGLLSDPARAAELRGRAAEHGREMAWDAIARRHVASLERGAREHATPRWAPPAARFRTGRADPLPVLNLDHLRALTDDTGVLQHASFVVPRYEEGYCLDDNARALMLVTLLEQPRSPDRRSMRSLASRYLAYVRHAFDPSSGRFRNFMNYTREWSEPRGSEDSHGRALWALGTVVGHATDPGRWRLGDDLFRQALPALVDFSSPRAWAYALLGIDQYLRVHGGDAQVEGMRALLVDRLLGLHQRTSGDQWPWFEPSVTYCNARLSQALILSGSATAHPEVVAVGIRSLAWLFEVQTNAEGHFAPVGSNGFYHRGGIAARWDQQPVEAGGMVSACLSAVAVTGDAEWSRRATTAFGWFLGENELHVPLYDASTGGCRDGLHADRVNENQGAESTISFLLALREMRGRIL
jgi:glycosyltransferase involved in cell wall biosynthesis